MTLLKLHCSIKRLPELRDNAKLNDINFFN